MTARPASRPCGSCPYRRDVPSGVWDVSEYDKLPPYDNETPFQPPTAFFCHQQDGRLCAGWVGCHDMNESLGLRLAARIGLLSPEDYEAVLDYRSPVPLWSSGAEAAEHGRAEIEAPAEKARRTIRKLNRRQPRGGQMATKRAQVEELMDKGLNAGEIAEQLGITKQYAYTMMSRIRKAAGAPPRGRGPKRKAPVEAAAQNGRPPAFNAKLIAEIEQRASVVLAEIQAREAELTQLAGVKSALGG